MKDSSFEGTSYEQILLGELPPGFPSDHIESGAQKIPKLASFEVEDVPTELIPFNDVSRAASLSTSAAHFYKADYKFKTAILRPLELVTHLRQFGFVLTPDLTLGDKMPPWQRIRNTVLSRAAGVIWQSRGIKVVPSLRWRDESDYEFVGSGLEPRSIFAVSSVGTRNDPRETQIFETGLRHFVQNLEPRVVLIHGTINFHLWNWLSDETQVLIYKPDSHFRRGKNEGPEEKLFV